MGQTISNFFGPSETALKEDLDRFAYDISQNNSVEGIETYIPAIDKIIDQAQEYNYASALSRAKATRHFAIRRIDRLREKERTAARERRLALLRSNFVVTSKKESTTAMEGRRNKLRAAILQSSQNRLSLAQAAGILREIRDKSKSITTVKMQMRYIRKIDQVIASLEYHRQFRRYNQKVLRDITKTLRQAHKLRTEIRSVTLEDDVDPELDAVAEAIDLPSVEFIDEEGKVENKYVVYNNDDEESPIAVTELVTIEQIKEKITEDQYKNYGLLEGDFLYVMHDPAGPTEYFTQANDQTKLLGRGLPEHYIALYFILYHKANGTTFITRATNTYDLESDNENTKWNYIIPTSAKLSNITIQSNNTQAGYLPYTFIDKKTGDELDIPSRYHPDDANTFCLFYALGEHSFLPMPTEEQCVQIVMTYLRTRRSFIRVRSNTQSYQQYIDAYCKFFNITNLHVDVYRVNGSYLQRQNGYKGNKDENAAEYPDLAKIVKYCGHIWCYEDSAQRKATVARVNKLPNFDAIPEDAPDRDGLTLFYLIKRCARDFRENLCTDIMNIADKERKLYERFSNNTLSIHEALMQDPEDTMHVSHDPQGVGENPATFFLDNDWKLYTLREEEMNHSGKCLSHVLEQCQRAEPATKTVIVAENLSKLVTEDSDFFFSNKDGTIVNGVQRKGQQYNQIMGTYSVRYQAQKRRRSGQTTTIHFRITDSQQYLHIEPDCDWKQALNAMQMGFSYITSMSMYSALTGPSFVYKLMAETRPTTKVQGCAAEFCRQAVVGPRIYCAKNQVQEDHVSVDKVALYNSVLSRAIFPVNKAPKVLRPEGAEEIQQRLEEVINNEGALRDLEELPRAYFLVSLTVKDTNLDIPVVATSSDEDPTKIKWKHSTYLKNAVISDIQLFSLLKHCTVTNIEHKGGLWWPESANESFKDIVEPLESLGEVIPEETKKAFKVVKTALWGKFAQKNHDKNIIIPKGQPQRYGAVINDNISDILKVESEGRYYNITMRDRNENPTMVHLAGFVLDGAREVMNELFDIVRQEGGRVFYTHTDSAMVSVDVYDRLVQRGLIGRGINQFHDDNDKICPESGRTDVSVIFDGYYRGPNVYVNKFYDDSVKLRYSGIPKNVIRYVEKTYKYDTIKKMLQNGDADARLKRIFLCNNLIAKKRNISVEEAHKWYLQNSNGSETKHQTAARIEERCTSKCGSALEEIIPLTEMPTEHAPEEENMQKLIGKELYGPDFYAMNITDYWAHINGISGKEVDLSKVLGEIRTYSKKEKWQLKMNIRKFTDEQAMTMIGL